MVIERVEIEVVSGQEEAFEATMNDQGTALLAGAQGCTDVTVARGVESPSRFLLLLTWGSVDEHIAFTQTEQFEQFGGLVGGFFAAKPAMEHFAPGG